jgi:hypothetical protein
MAHSFCDLPLEIQLKIAAYLDRQDIGRLACVSKDMRSLTNDNELWYKLYIRKNGVPTPDMIALLLDNPLVHK